MAKRYYNLEKETKEYLKACEAKSIVNQTNIKTLNDFVINRKTRNLNTTFLANSPIVLNGLVLWFDAGVSDSYPAGGTAWKDLAGSNNGTLTNGPTFTKSNGGSLVFDGSNDYVDIGNPSSLQSLTQGSIEAFYYRTASTATYQMIFTDVNSDLEITYATNTLQFYIGNSGIGYSHAITGQWFHVVGVWGVGFKRLYLNGAEVASGTNTGLNTGSRVRYIGSRAGSLPFNGLIPVLRAYNRTLTPTEILQNYNAMKGRFGL
jgi:hypothetical protein